MNLGYSPTTAAILNLEQAFRLAVDLELQFIELSWEPYEIAPEVQPAKRVVELARATGVNTTLHLPFVDLNTASLVPDARRMAVDRTLAALEYAGTVGASCAVIHSGQNYFYHPLTTEYAREAMGASFAALQGAPVPVALENLAQSPFDLVREPEGLQAVTQEAGFRNCLDFGHAHVESFQSWRPEHRRGEDLLQRYIDTLAENIIHLHVHGNDGTADQHRATCEGTVPFEKHAHFLQSFRGTVCLEVTGGEDALRTSIAHLRSLVSSVMTPAC